MSKITLALVTITGLAVLMPSQKAAASVLNADDYANYVTYFNGMEPEESPTFNIVRNAQSWDWMKQNIPLFDCPDDGFKKIYYYRWWCYRKHIKYPTTAGYSGFGITEWSYFANPSSSPFCHHISEGRWLHTQTYLDQDIRYWFRTISGGPRGYSQWSADAIYGRYLVNMDKAFLVDLLPDLKADHQAWEASNMRADGLFWSYDVRDSMEESISGNDKPKTVTEDPNQNIRPTLNSYMAADRRAIARIALLADPCDTDGTAALYQGKYDDLRTKMIAAMWDAPAKFFKVQYEAGGLCSAREAIGFIPYKFNIPGPEHAEAWSQLADPCGFWAPRGLTTAERRHRDFRSHGTGGCEWDGPVWPFATSQTLDGLANVLCGPGPYYATKQNYFDAMMIYAQSHQYPDPLYAYPNNLYLGEYMDEITNYWLKGPNSPRSRYYNHSTFADLVISGLVGLKPRPDNTVEVNPLVPSTAWDWFCLDQVQYHNHMLTIVWDRYGTHYNRGAGFRVYCNDQQIAYSANLERITGEIPTVADSQAPTPSVMTWAVGPYAPNRNCIQMTATTATDASGVEYYFACTSGGGHDSGWQVSPTYMDIGLLQGTAYTYTVKARDTSTSRNETAVSAPASATITPVFPILINFQKADEGQTVIPTGYEMDCGYLYGNRGCGLSFGWNINHASGNPLTRTLSSDQRLNTVTPIRYMLVNGVYVAGVWEIAVPNGTYSVSVTVGDPCSSSTNTVNVEGKNFWTAQALAANNFSTVNRNDIVVSDGKITLDNGGVADKVTRLCYAIITQQHPSYTCSGYPAADLSADCQVNFADLVVLARSWTSTKAGGLDLRQLATDWLICNRSPGTECWK